MFLPQLGCGPEAGKPAGRKEYSIPPPGPTSHICAYAWPGT